MPAASHENLLESLNRGARSAAELGLALGASQPTISRLLGPLVRDQIVLRMGTTRNARYARAKVQPELGASQWPIYRVNAQGEARPWGTLHMLMADQYFVALHLDVQNRVLQSLYDGLPYFLQDQRPAGFMGRNVPLRYPELQLPQRVTDWSDTHYLRYLTQHGWDAVSDLIVGEVALNRFLATQVVAVPVEARLAHYSEQARIVTAGGLPGSSAHGEHPKFVTVINDGGVIQHRLIKFSPPRATELGQRWSDLLVAEHHAHVVLREAGFSACQSQVHITRERTYLEMPRFDRIGVRGRNGVTSLFAIDTALYGQLDNWIAAAQRLHSAHKLSATDLRSVQFLSAFGELIANTDRHFGNLAMFDDYTGSFTLAPAYDMLPMLFAPQHDQLIEREFVPPPPSAATLAVWPQAQTLAQRYWHELSVDARVSDEFRNQCLRCLNALTGGR